MSSDSSSRTLEVDLQNPQHAEIAERLLRALCREAGDGVAVAVSILMVTDALLAVLHAESPTPKRNVFAVRRMLRDLVANVRAHEECAEADDVRHAQVH